MKTHNMFKHPIALHAGLNKHVLFHNNTVQTNKQTNKQTNTLPIHIGTLTA